MGGKDYSDHARDTCILYRVHLGVPDLWQELFLQVMCKIQIAEIIESSKDREVKLSPILTSTKEARDSYIVWT